MTNIYRTTSNLPSPAPIPPPIPVPLPEGDSWEKVISLDLGR